jgi:hypothetical protein
MPYLTPNTLPEERACRALSIPLSTDWLAIVSGALTELTKKYNWQQNGAVTVDEAIAAMQEMIDAYYNGCPPCTTQPGGMRIIRIGADGHLEQVGDTGEWEPASGDYAYPPIPVRTGTEVDVVCLAATNAENVLHLIYEQLTDYFASELTPAEALTALMTWLLETFEIGAGTIVFALVAFILPVFVLVWGALAYLSADLWDESFSNAFTCMLIGCASDDAGVITFDWDCIESALYLAAVTFEISETQLRLYAQINYIIWTLGGVDALNTMGATTAVTAADCAYCNDGWCYSVDLTSSNGGFVLAGAGQGAYSAGTGWVATDVILGGALRTILQGSFNFDFTLALTEIGFAYDWHEGEIQSGVVGIGLWINNFSEEVFTTPMQDVTPGNDLASSTPVMLNADSVNIDMQTSHNSYGGNATLKSVTLRGTGTVPTFLEASGWVSC